MDCFLSNILSLTLKLLHYIFLTFTICRLNIRFHIFLKQIFIFLILSFKYFIYIKLSIIIIYHISKYIVCACKEKSLVANENSSVICRFEFYRVTIQYSMTIVNKYWRLLCQHSMVWLWWGSKVETGCSWIEEVLS